MNKKPLGRKAYGSIGHLPCSRVGPADHHVEKGMAKICTEKARDKKDIIIVQEKLDGSCVSAAKINGEIVALTRAGYLATTSPYHQHHLWHEFVVKHAKRFDRLLEDGERAVGEWLAQAHGTLYEIEEGEPFFLFDIMQDANRQTYRELLERNRGGGYFRRPTTLHVGNPISVEDAMELHREHGTECDEPEGVVYRVERAGVVDFLAKWVRPDKVDGKYLPSVSGAPPVWNIDIKDAPELAAR